MQGQPGSGPGAGSGGAAGGNVVAGTTGTYGGELGTFGTGGSGGGGGPSIAGTGTTPTLDNPAGTTLMGGVGQSSGNNTSGGAGGYGVVVTAGGGSNAGTINGGAGGASGGASLGPGGGSGNGGNGGGALFLGSDIVFNNGGGTIAGGGQGGAFLVTSGGGTTPQNGGAGGRGGAGVEFVGSNLTFNMLGGLVAGASGGGAGSGGNNANAGGTAGTGGAGGAGGAGVVFDQSTVVLNNTGGTIRGGVGVSGAEGGQNVSVAGGFGGTGGLGGAGGTGVAFQGSQSILNNTGTIVGGMAGGGGSGLAGSASNVGAGTGGNGGAGGNGGTGVTFAGQGNQLRNIGTIAGGNGRRGGTGGEGASGNADIGASGAGGIGVLATDTVITNGPGSVIAGGNGGAAGGRGGVGIAGSDLVISNTGGTINGGFTNTATAADNPPVVTIGPGGTVVVGPATEPFTAGSQAYAIQFTGGANNVGTGGTIQGGIYVASGSFQPALAGSSVGTPLAVTGPIAFAPGTFYNVRITPTANDSVAATGAGTVSDATVNVEAGAGTYQTRRYTILTATQGVTGTFSGVTSNLAFLAPTLSYDANDVYLNIVVATPTAAGTPDYRTAAATRNQYAVATGLTRAGILNGGKGRILTAFNQLTVQQARAAFDSLSGEGITAAQNVANRSSQLFTSSIFDQTTFYGGGAANSVTVTEPAPGMVSLAARQGQPIRELADLPSSKVTPIFVAPTRTWRAWATGFGGTEDIHGNAVIGSVAQSNDIYGGALGVDYQMLPNFLIGVAVGGSNGDFTVAQRGTTGSTTGGHVALYDLATFGSYYGASSIAFSDFDNKTNRMIGGFGGLSAETLRGHFNSDEFRGRFEAGRHFAGVTGFGTITPYVAIEAASLRSSGFGETAINGSNLLGLNVASQSAADVPGFVGLRFQNIMPLGSLTLLPTLQVAYEHEFAPYRQETAALINLPGSTFLVDGARPARNAAQVKAGGELKVGPNSALFANFDGEFSGVEQAYAGKGGFRYVW